MYDRRIFDVDHRPVRARGPQGLPPDRRRRVGAASTCRAFADGSIYDEITFVDFYRYVDVGLDEVYDFLDRPTRALGPARGHRPLDQLPDQRRRHPRPPAGAGLPQLRPALQLGRPPRPQATRGRPPRARRRHRRGLRQRGDGRDRLPAEATGPASPHGSLASWPTTRRPRPVADDAELRAGPGRPPCPTTCCRPASSIHAPGPARSRSTARSIGPPSGGSGRGTPTASAPGRPGPAPIDLDLSWTCRPTSGTAVAALRAVWAWTFDREVDPGDNFFDLGGDSITAIQIVDRAAAVGPGPDPAPAVRGARRLAATALLAGRRCDRGLEPDRVGAGAGGRRRAPAAVRPQLTRRASRAPGGPRPDRCR